MRRPGPRPLAAALSDATAELAPVTLLARVQAVWQDVAGEVVAEEAEPVSVRGGEVRFACRSASWAQELDLLAPDLRSRLNEALGGAPEGPVAALRFRPGAPPGAPRGNDP